MTCKGPRLSRPNPVDGLSSQTLNYVHNFNLTENPKRKWPHLESMSWGLTWSCDVLQTVKLRTLLGSSEKTDVVAASGYAANGQSEKRWSQRQREVVSTQIDIDKWEKEKGEAQYSGQQFNTTKSTGETRKKGRLFTLLKRITNSKV